MAKTIESGGENIWRNNGESGESWRWRNNGVWRSKA
jgi:hypothetical protein